MLDLGFALIAEDDGDDIELCGFIGDFELFQKALCGSGNVSSFFGVDRGYGGHEVFVAAGFDFHENDATSVPGNDVTLSQHVPVITGQNFIALPFQALHREGLPFFTYFLMVVQHGGKIIHDQG